MNDFPHLRATDPEIAALLDAELTRQRDHLELIASENFTSRAVLEAMGTVPTNKYAEGYPGKRYYGGCVHVDGMETLAIDRACSLFGSEHANVQPHSGANANMAVFLAALKPGDTILGMDLSHGGHLTHGSPVNASGLLYRIVSYGVEPETETLDYDRVAALAREHRPKLIIAGASAYARTLDFARFRAIADEVGALLLVDMAHIAGLVAAGVHPSPVPHAHFVTTTTHKTLRGPRGGMILTSAEWAKAIDKAVFPGLQGGPLMHIIAAKAVSFHEALQPGFRRYQEQVVANARAMAAELVTSGTRIVSGGTDTHLFSVDVRSVGLTGKVASQVLDDVGITVNKNTIPFDPESPFITSGIRIGTPAVTTRAMGEPEMRKIAGAIVRALRAGGDAAELTAVRATVAELCAAFPLYAESLVGVS